MGSQDMPYVSVIIPVLNDASRLAKCLKALDSQTYPVECFEVIVVDNGSKEKIIQDPGLRVLIRYFEEKVRGSGAARNTGVRQAKGEIIAFTDSDCIPAFDWIAQGVAALKAQDAGMVGGRIDYHFTGSGKPETAAQLYDYVIFLKQDTSLERFHALATANLFVKKTLFDVCGVFDTRMRYSSDFEWTRKAFCRGFRQVYGDRAIVSHEAKVRLPQIIKRAWGFMTYEYLLSSRNQVKKGRAVGELSVGQRIGFLVKEIFYVASTKKLISWVQRSKVVAIILLCAVLRVVVSVKCCLSEWLPRPYRKL